MDMQFNASTQISIVRHISILALLMLAAPSVFGQVMYSVRDLGGGAAYGVNNSGQVVGYTYVIQRNTDLTNTNGWATLATLTLTNPVQMWKDTSVNAALPANAQGFYRVLPGQ